MNLTKIAMSLLLTLQGNYKNGFFRLFCAVQLKAINVKRSALKSAVHFGRKCQAFDVKLKRNNLEKPANLSLRSAVGL